MARRNWNREELILAFNLYCKTPFTKINSRNNGVVELSKIIERSSSAIALKLANFARLDPALKERNISGMKNGSKAELEIWKEFHDDWGKLAQESESLLFRKEPLAIKKTSLNDFAPPPSGDDEVLRYKRERVSQSFFRQVVIASYDYRCCISSCNNQELLNASHIVPWSIDSQNRTNPANGLCLNVLYDRAFDRGLITIDSNLRVKVSNELRLEKGFFCAFFAPYDGKKIILPHKFTPNISFLEYHQEKVFRP